MAECIAESCKTLLAKNSGVLKKPSAFPRPAESLFNQVVAGDAREVLKALPADSVDLSFWSPPYHVGKSYERGWTFEQWKSLIRTLFFVTHRF